MNTFTQTFDNLLDEIQAILMSILTKLGPFFVALMPALFTAYAIFHTFKEEAGQPLAMLFAVVVGLAMETVGIVATHTAIDLYNATQDSVIQPVKFWLMVAFVPVYVVGVAGVVYFSQDAFTPLVKGLGVASPFLTTIVYVAVALARDIRRAEARQTIIEGKQAQLEADHRQWTREKERMELEQRHQEKLARIESKSSTDRSINRLTRNLDHSVEPFNTATLDVLNAKRAQDKEQALTDLLTYLNNHPNASLNEIGRVIGRSKATVFNYTERVGFNIK